MNGIEKLSDQPKIDEKGTKRWYNAEGQLHRLDGPAIEYANGSKEWYKEGQFHRLDGPALEYANGSKYWFLNDKRHRLDGPAVELADGDKCWYQNDKLHRTDGPAVEYADGGKKWYLEGVNYTEEEFLAKVSNQPEVDKDGKKTWRNSNGQLHRTDGPAVEYGNGDKCWYVEGKFHRLDGPAVERANGDKRWYVEGKRHRLDGPAIEFANGDKEWYVEDVKFSEREFKKKTSKKKIINSIKQGTQVGVVTEAANIIYDRIEDVLVNLLGADRKAIKNPVNKELIMLVAISVSHLGSEIYQDKVNKNQIQEICGLILEGKVKDNTKILLRCLPFLKQVSEKMNPEIKSRIAVNNICDSDYELESFSEYSNATEEFAFTQNSERK